MLVKARGRQTSKLAMTALSSRHTFLEVYPPRLGPPAPAARSFFGLLYSDHRIRCGRRSFAVKTADMP